MSMDLDGLQSRFGAADIGDSYWQDDGCKDAGAKAVISQLERQGARREDGVVRVSSDRTVFQDAWRESPDGFLTGAPANEGKYTRVAEPAQADAWRDIDPERREAPGGKRLIPDGAVDPFDKIAVDPEGLGDRL